MNTYNRGVCAIVMLMSPLMTKAQESGASVPPVSSAAEESSVQGTGEMPSGPLAQEPAASESGLPPQGVDALVLGGASTDLTPLAATDVVSAAPAVVGEKAKDTLSVDFPDEDIRNILRNVADLFELNIVVPESLQGRTSIKLRDVTWRQIFKVVLSPVGYTFVEDGNIIKIVTIESLSQEPFGTEVYVLNYARAEDIEKSILPLVDSAAGGRVLVDKRINALIISERPSRLARITPVLESLDKATEQVMIESKFIEVNDTDVKNLGVNWSSLSNYQIGYSPTDLLLSGSNRASIGTNTGGTESGPDPTTAGKAYGAVLSAPQLNVALRALQTSSNSKVVSNPTIVTLNNAPAEINVGEEYPIPSYTYNAEQGNFEVSGFEYKPIGVLLKVTPQVNSQGFIRLNLEPEISIRGDSVTFGGASGAEIPIIRTRKTKTQVTMKDGHTLAIGGLIDSTTLKGESKVPGLGSIPGIGRLFRSNTKDNSNRNLLIFITSKVVSSDSASTQDVFSPEQIRGAGLKRSDLPGRRSTQESFLPEELPPELKEQQ